MEIKLNDEMVELKFGFKFLKSLNDEFSTEEKGMKVDAGIINSYVTFQTLDPYGLFKIVKCAISHINRRPNDEKLFDSFDDLVEEEYQGDLEKFAEDLKDEMGKRPIIKASIDRIEKATENQGF